MAPANCRGDFFVLCAKNLNELLFSTLSPSAASSLSPDEHNSSSGKSSPHYAQPTTSSSALYTSTLGRVAPPPPSDKKFTVAVIGVSGDGVVKGASGVGKSCLCNRFVRPAEDAYNSEHLSTLSQVNDIEELFVQIYFFLRRTSPARK